MSDQKDIKIIFVGTDEFGVPILLDLIKNFHVVGVVTEIDKPAGRNKTITAPLIKQLALKQNIPYWQPLELKKNPKLYDELGKLEADIMVLTAYGKILPEAMINLTPNGCVNIHPSLLPKYRGATPIESALLNGDNETGVSIILLDTKLDSGDIVAQSTIPIENEDNYLKLSKKLALESIRILNKAIKVLIKSKPNLITQNDDNASYCYKLTKEDGRIDWRKSADDIYNQMRAYASWPGTYTFWNNEKLDIVKAKPVEDCKDESPGTVYRSDDQILVSCGRDALSLQQIKLAGKKEIPIKDFINGHQDFIGSVLK